MPDILQGSVATHLMSDNFCKYAYYGFTADFRVNEH